MIRWSKPPPEPLREARRALEGLSGVELLRDWEWLDAKCRWVLHCRLRLDGPGSDLVPRSSEWYVLVEPTYPWGRIQFFPSAKDSIQRTFHHQSYNGPPGKDTDWRKGHLCLSSDIALIRRTGFDEDPREPHLRLLVHFQRALAWLEAAAKDELALPGEAFELPPVPDTVENGTVVFNEDAANLAFWLRTEHRMGIAELGVVNGNPDHFYVRRFLSSNGGGLLTSSWGKAFGEDRLKVRGIWMRIGGIPVQLPWHIPGTWGELRSICRAQQFDLDNVLKTCVPSVRSSGKHPLLIGFPVPEVYGGPPRQLHWLAIRLPQLSFGRYSAKGFRNNERGYWMRDRREILTDKQHISWSDTQNWNAAQLSSRGRLPDTVRDARVLLIGAGTLGAALSELLVRGGTNHLVIIDDDILKAGNLARHTLAMADVGRFKSFSLADRLRQLSPHASIDPIIDSFVPSAATDQDLVRKCELVIDCTGSDEVIHLLEAFHWNGDRAFFSFSFGHRARRFFCFSAIGNRFPESRFIELSAPYIADEHLSIAEDPPAREGLGCWNPVFPARADDVWMWATVAVRYLEDRLALLPDGPRLDVFEQVRDEEGFAGVHRITSRKAPKNQEAAISEPFAEGTPVADRRLDV